MSDTSDLNKWISFIPFPSYCTEHSLMGNDKWILLLLVFYYPQSKPGCHVWCLNVIFFQEHPAGEEDDPGQGDLRPRLPVLHAHLGPEEGPALHPHLQYRGHQHQQRLHPAHEELQVSLIVYIIRHTCCWCQMGSVLHLHLVPGHLAALAHMLPRHGQPVPARWVANLVWQLSQCQEHNRERYCWLGFLLTECSMVLLTFGLLSNPLIHPGQNKDVQVRWADGLYHTATLSDMLMLSGNN